MAEKNERFGSQFILLGIVAIVAIVGLVTLLTPAIQANISGQECVLSDAAYDMQDETFYSGANVVGQAAAVAYDCWYYNEDGELISRSGGCSTYTGSMMAKACRRSGGTCHAPSEI